MDAKKIESYTAEDYFNLPENTRVELIDGVFYDMASPSLNHQLIVSELNRQIGNHIKEKGGPCKVLPAPFTVKLYDDVVVEPDISVICDPKKLTEKGCNGAPDWVIEIVSPSSSGNDYIRKLQLYHSAGVLEYWIVDPGSEMVTVYDLTAENLSPKSYSMKDTIKVGIYEDFSIDMGTVPG